MSYNPALTRYKLAKNNTMGSVDLYQLEKQLATRTTASLRRSIRSAIQQTTNSKTSTGEALKRSGSRAVFKFDRLQRITIRAPHYIFKQHHGFEGPKKNRVNMRLKATGVITQAVNSTNVINTLADEISEIRLSQITAKINFK